MAHETSKQATRRSADRRYATRWMKGEGIDIGCGADSLAALTSFFPLMTSVRSWDLPDGDAMLMEGVPDRAFDFVHSSHCLEHLVDPYLSLSNWIRICREGGHILVTIPDEDLYEQGVWPSTFNADHKWSFTIAKAASWSPRSVNIFDLVGRFVDEVEVLKVELLDSGFQYGHPRHDQSWGVLSESAIEIVLRKKRASVADGASRGSDAHDLSFALALSHHREGRAREAAAMYRRLVALDPGDVASLNNLSYLVEADEAEGLLTRAVTLKPDFLDAQWSLGMALKARGEMARARECFEAVTAARPDHAAAFHALGLCLQASDRFTEALEAMNRAIEIDPGLVDAHFQSGMIHIVLCRHEEAVEAFGRAVALDPGHALAHVYRGHVQLGGGDFEAGAEALQWIWKARGLENQSGIFAPGEPGARDLDGQVIVLSADSGLGDTLQFVRYAGLLKARGAGVVVECQPDLMRLLRNAHGVDDVVPLGEVLPPFDRRVPLHNLLCAFGTTLETIPVPVPYIEAVPSEVESWTRRLAAHRGVKVGLLWAGSADHAADRRRSIPEMMLRPLTDVGGATFVSLQKSRAARDLDLVDFTGDLGDLADAAALIQSLDLVIAVDSALAHLAGALGRPVWLLNRFDSCWRWLRERPDSPWYPTLRQFRQTRAGDWAPVVAEAAAALSERVLRDGRRPAPGPGRPARETRAVLAEVA